MKIFFRAWLLCLLAGSASATLPVTGVYDENVVSANVVDRSATFLGGEDAGNDPALVLDVHAFSSLLTPAFQKGSGGVVDFETGTLDSPKEFTIFFNNEAKHLIVRQNTGSGISIKSYEKEVRTPISGTHALAKDAGSADFDFQFMSPVGGARGEEVVAFGATLLGRNGSNARSSWTGVAAIHDRQGHTGVITNRVANLNTGSGNATDDAFFGFRSPAGWFITGVTIYSDNGAFTALDDLAFVTAVVSEPQLSVAAAAPAAPSDVRVGGFKIEWWIVGALWVIVALLVAMIWMLRGVNRPKLSGPEPTSSTVPTVRIDATHAWTEELAPNKMPAELMEFAKQNLVQELYSQRQALVETQKRAEQQLAELENWLNQVQFPLRDRIRAYEERINVLEKELVTKDESVRELTHATLLLIRQKVEEEKERERNINRFS